MSEPWEKYFDFKFTTFGRGRFLRQGIKTDDVKKFIKSLLSCEKPYFYYECPTCKYRIAEVEWEAHKYRYRIFCPRGCKISLSDFRRSGNESCGK